METRVRGGEERKEQAERAVGREKRIHAGCGEARAPGYMRADGRPTQAIGPRVPLPPRDPYTAPQPVGGVSSARRR